MYESEWTPVLAPQFERNVWRAPWRLGFSGITCNCAHRRHCFSGNPWRPRIEPQSRMHFPNTQRHSHRQPSETLEVLELSPLERALVSRVLPGLLAKPKSRHLLLLSVSLRGGSYRRNLKDSHYWSIFKLRGRNRAKWLSTD